MREVWENIGKRGGNKREKQRKVGGTQYDGEIKDKEKNQKEEKIRSTRSKR